MKRIVSGTLLMLLLVSMFSFALTVRLARAQGETVYINSDGSVSPSSAPISTGDNITYTLTGNISYPVYEGIIVERSNIVIDGNSCTVQGDENSNGLSLEKVNNVTIENTSIENFECGIYLNSSTCSSMSGNNITNNADYGIDLDYSSGNSMSGNNITNDGFGIYFSSSSSNNIDENSITNNWDGIDLDYSSGNSMSGNNITNSGDIGIYLGFSSDNSIDGNSIRNSYYYGIILNYSSGNSMSGNNITAPARIGVAIRVFGSSGNSMSRNNITNNGDFIDLYFSSGNSMSWNNIINNEYGVVLYSSSNNEVYHNNFIDNGRQVYDYSWDFPSLTPSTNIWDDGYPLGGNYWSNYNGIDFYNGPYQNVTGSDGIGDTPYIIDANNLDHYPLMLAFGTVPVAVTNIAVYTIYNRTYIYQGMPTNITITVWNKAEFREYVAVTLYYNMTGGGVVGVQNVTVLSEQNMTVLFVWNTAGVLPCYTNYTFTAVATIPTGANTLSDGNITVRFKGDINGDGKVDLKDINIAAKAYGTVPGNSNWNPDADVNGDDKIDIRDIALIASHFGQHYP